MQDTSGKHSGRPHRLALLAQGPSRVDGCRRCPRDQRTVPHRHPQDAAAEDTRWALGVRTTRRAESRTFPPLLLTFAGGPWATLCSWSAQAVQQIESNLLEPLVVEEAVSLHPAAVLVAVTVVDSRRGVLVRKSRKRRRKSEQGRTRGETVTGCTSRPWEASVVRARPPREKRTMKKARWVS